MALSEMFGKILNGIGYVIAAPFRAFYHTIEQLINLDRRQMRSFFSVMMILGIFALSMQNIYYIWLSRQYLISGRAFDEWMEFVFHQAELNSYMIMWSQGIIGLVVFGADFFRASLGKANISLGKGLDKSEIDDNPI